MRNLECFLLKYIRKRREEKSGLSKAKSEPSVACTGKHMGQIGDVIRDRLICQCSFILYLRNNMSVDMWK